MPSEEELASTIEELARKLDTVDEDTIRDELERYLNHGVPLHQAKKDLANTLATNTSSTPTPTEAVDKTVNEITTQDQNVNLTVKILSVNEREITARGEEKTIWSGMLGDETGAVAYTAWRDVGLEPNAVVRLENAYITEWQDDPQVNIGDHAQVEPQDTNLEVPPPSARSTEHAIEDLEDGMSSVTVTARVLSKAARDVTVQGEDTTLWEGEIGDATGRIPYTAWHDHGFTEGDVVQIENAYVRSFRGTPQLNFGENATLTKQPDDAVPDADALAELPGPERETTEKQIQALAPGDSSVKVTGRVVSKSKRQIQSDGETRTLWEGEIGDATGRIPYTAWHDHGFTEGDVVEIENAYVRSFRGIPQLNFGDNATLTKQPDDAVPPKEALMGTHETSIQALQAAQGAIGVQIEGVVLEVRDGSGLILRCPECRRVLQQRECRMHGRVDGVPDLRIKAVVDDGTGGVMVLFDRGATERLLGKSLEACEAEAEDAMNRDVIAKEVKETLLMQRVQLGGNATHDEYGTTLLVNEATFPELEDAEDRAEAMIEQVEALSQEVAA